MAVKRCVDRRAIGLGREDEPGVLRHVRFGGGA